MEKECCRGGRQNKKGCFTVKIKVLTIINFFVFAFLLGGGGTVQAVEEDVEKIDPDINILVVFSSENGSTDEHQRLLDLSLGHFSENIDYRSVEDVEQSDLEGQTHLLYYGQTEEELSPVISNLFSTFDGPTMAIGHNVEQLGDTYSFLEVGGEATITELEYIGDEEKTREIQPNSVFATTLSEGADTHVEGSGEQGEFPLIMSEGDHYYMASDSIVPPYSVYFSQALNTFFDIEPIDQTPAYIRLEDIHPLSDPKRLMAIAEELESRDIPYMMAVIPVYTDPETGREYHFEDSPDVLEALRYMQDNGGSVVLHGYTHQFRESETGEGFEFWDVENQMPIYHEPEEEVVQRTEGDFENQEGYESYIAENLEFEREYIEERLTRGVQELSNYGIYPLAFEAPHYTMSQHGYEVTSDFFSTYVGQVQLSDERWEIMNSTPYASQPEVLNGMRLLPETIGFVDPDEDNPIENMMDSAEHYQVTEGGMIGAFYHPYLGEDDFVTLLDEMEAVENVEWVDLKEMDNTVAVDNVSISSGNGEVQADVNQLGLMTTSLDFPFYHIGQTVITITWAIALIGIAGVLMFVVFTFSQGVKGRRSEKRLVKHSKKAKEKRTRKDSVDHG